MAKTTDYNQRENRVLVLMPTGRDAFLVCATLEKVGIEAEPCADAPELMEKISAGAGAILLAEEALPNGTFEQLAAAFEAQPVWSDLPVVLFAGSAQSAEMLAATVGTPFNATIVERPIRIPMLVSAVRGALRARQRQYLSRNLLNQLEESDRQKDLFLATLSHELRTPLNSILGWIQLLRGKSSQKIDTAHGLDVIERNAKAQAEIVSDILFVSRIITGKLTLEIKPIDLIPVIRQAVEVLHPAVEAKEITLETFFDSNIRQINGNGDRLKQVFWNILSNAVKFTPPNGKIEVRATVNGTDVEIEISDNGQGIEPDFLPYIFERFRQADSSYTRQAGGLGLGLAIVRHLVKMHGGQVNVSSEGLNRGTSFTVALPIYNSPDAPLEEATESSLADDGGEKFAGVRILLVEDNDDSREMLKVLFAQCNYETTAVATAAEALAAIEKNNPDILISDIGMPDENGYDLIRRVRDLAPEKGGNIPAIALTGYASVEDCARAVQAGFQEHFSKPIEIDGLIALIEKLLNRVPQVSRLRS